MPGSSRQRSTVLLSVASLVASIALLAPVPSLAYRVFFDHDTDGDLGTFSNEMVGPKSASVTIVVELDKTDGSPPWIHFNIYWVCEDDFFLGRGSIANEVCCSWPPAFPFTKINWETCGIENCWCQSSREFIADFQKPAPEGSWTLATLELSRVGHTGKLHDQVDFWIECPACDYAPGDEAKMVFSLRSESAKAAKSTWGALKSRYR